MSKYIFKEYAPPKDFIEALGLGSGWLARAIDEWFEMLKKILNMNVASNRAKWFADRNLVEDGRSKLLLSSWIDIKEKWFKSDADKLQLLDIEKRAERLSVEQASEPKKDTEQFKDLTNDELKEKIKEMREQRTNAKKEQEQERLYQAFEAERMKPIYERKEREWNSHVANAFQENAARNDGKFKNETNINLPRAKAA
jgi:hypothetical protein